MQSLANKTPNKNPPEGYSLMLKSKFFKEI